MSLRPSPSFSAVTTLTALLTASATFAQAGPPQPAAELEKFAPLVGHWQGTGTAQMAPSQPESRWTSTNVYSWILGNHVLQETTRIEFPDLPIPAMEFISFYCYDTQRKAYRTYGIDNAGTASSSDLNWIDGVMTSTSRGHQDGMPFFDHWVTKIDDDTMEFVGNRMLGTNPPFVHVQGKMKRVEAKDANPTEEASPAEASMAQPSEPMERLAKMVGNYKLEGSMVPLPGMPAMPITARTEVTTMFGGTTLVMRDIGDPIDGVPGPTYEGVHYLCWDEANQQYAHFGMNNMGESGDAPGVWLNNTLVFNSSHPVRGMPSAYRTMITVNDEGQLVRTIADMLGGTHKAETVFDAKFTPTKS